MRVDVSQESVRAAFDLFENSLNVRYHGEYQALAIPTG